MKLVTPTKNVHVDVKEINRQAQNPAVFVESCEREYESQLAALVENVIARKSKIIMLAGPSSSGKTTTANKLSRLFEKQGDCAPVVSLDDFFLGIAHYPRLPDGTPDMEAVEALDLPYIGECFRTLLKEGKAYFPLFDFETSSRKAEQNLVTLEENDVLIVEGLHALNPRIFESLDRDSMFLAYVSARTQYVEEGEAVLTPKNNRLMRRIVRDHRTRGKSPQGTLDSWAGVLAGEEKYIYPFRDDADFKINSSMNYEGCIFHHYILPLLEKTKENGTLPPAMQSIWNSLERFADIDPTFIPCDSLLREFIGK